MKPKVFLAMPAKANKWTYGLARYEDGSIQVSEMLFSNQLFSPVGVDQGIPKENEEYDPADRKAERLSNGERLMIIGDIYIACCVEMGIRPNQKKLEEFQDKIDKAQRKRKNAKSK